MNSFSEMELPSNRKFGLFFCFLCSGISVFLLVNKQAGLAIVFGTFAIFFGFIASTKPHLLTWPNRAWAWCGYMLGRFISPIVLSVLFFLLLTPVALLGKFFKRDELRLKPSKSASYWIKREPLDSETEAFENQF